IGRGNTWARNRLLARLSRQVSALLFVFVKRQIMRFAVKSRRGPHVPVGHNAPKDLKEENDIRLSKVQGVKYEPQLLGEDHARLLQLQTPGNQHRYNRLYRTKASDAIRASEISFHSEGRTPFKGVRNALTDGTGVFGQPEYLHYQEALSELAAAAARARGGSSQAAAEDLTQPPEVSSPTTMQVTHLPSSQESKRAKHFLELKSLKDNCDTLESTLWLDLGIAIASTAPGGESSLYPGISPGQETRQLCSALTVCPEFWECVSADPSLAIPLPCGMTAP
uniref:Uncharacterized protein n=1 Tax=Vombatus ursinus TaxID=29139 RepID=A0A4X2JSA8_VOMUR